MKDKVLNLWKNQVSESFDTDSRVKTSAIATDSIDVDFGRSQCRTTHKRQDC